MCQELLKGYDCTAAPSTTDVGMHLSKPPDFAGVGGESMVSFC